MPLLPPGPVIFPEHLLRQPPAEEGAACWWVLHTRPRAEKTLARKCRERDLPFFLPLYRKRWVREGRHLASHLPLFPGYLFLHGDGAARAAALQTNLVAQALPVADQARLWADLSRVYRLVTSAAPLAPERCLPAGTPVEITGGPLAGLEGKVLRHGRRLRLVVEVRFLQQAVAAEIESWMIQPRSECPAPGRAGAS